MYRYMLAGRPCHLPLPCFCDSCTVPMNMKLWLCGHSISTLLASQLYLSPGQTGAREVITVEKRVRGRDREHRVVPTPTSHKSSLQSIVPPYIQWAMRAIKSGTLWETVGGDRRFRLPQWTRLWFVVFGSAASPSCPQLFANVAACGLRMTFVIAQFFSPLSVSSLFFGGPSYQVNRPMIHNHCEFQHVNKNAESNGQMFRKNKSDKVIKLMTYTNGGLENATSIYSVGGARARDVITVDFDSLTVYCHARRPHALLVLFLVVTN